MLEEGLNHIWESLIKYAQSQINSAWNQMADEKYERVGSIVTGTELQEGIISSIERLTQISEEYSQLYTENDKGIEYFILGNSARTIYEWFTFYLSHSVKDTRKIPTVMWINLIAETDVLCYLKDKWSKGLISPFPNRDGFSLFQYISPTIDVTTSTTFGDIYDRTHQETVSFLEKDEWIYKPLSRVHQSTRNPGIQDLYFPYLPDEQSIFRNSMKYSFFVMLDDSDFENLFSNIVIRYKSDRFWALDCASARSIVITPNGLRNLNQDHRLLESNAKHEAIHAYLDARIETKDNPMRSGQYLLPRWTIEGLSNYLSGRGRQDDGFRDRQINVIKENGLKEFEEIIGNDDEYYEYYTMVMYFLLSAITSSTYNDGWVELIQKDDQQRILDSIRILRQSIFFTKLPETDDFRNDFFWGIVMNTLSVSNTFEGISYQDLIVLFDANKEKIFEAYYEDVRLRIDLNKDPNYPINLD